MRSGRLLALTWHDKRPVSMLSTVHGASIVNSGRTDQSTGEEIKRNKVIVDYNTFMGGVDKLDQMIEPYFSTHKTIKWYMKFFQHSLDVAMQNPLRECRVCRASKKDGKRVRKQTRYMRVGCGSVALCVVPCFLSYHALVHYDHDAEDRGSDIEDTDSE